MNERVQEKLKILADAAKYDVSCASSGSDRKNKAGGMGNSTGMGICHSYTEDGRCVSLLKVLLTNYCIYDCAYCVSRKSNDIKRAAFTVEEVVDLTMSFYRRNYIEGLFLSSGIFKNADYTMERLVRIAKDLRTLHNFNGYIHLKLIPGASDELVQQAGLYADRLSANLELPSEASLKIIAPEKSYDQVYLPMNYLKEAIVEYRREKKQNRHTPIFAPAGQSTQMVIGASPETDLHILKLSSELYQNQNLKRVYYSGYIPVSNDTRLPTLVAPPLVRENRLYQADWLIRFYGFKYNEIVDDRNPHLDEQYDPKLVYALRNMHLFPVTLQTAPYEMILRVPGIGVKSAQKIVAARRYHSLHLDLLKKLRVAVNRAKYFINVPGNHLLKQYYPEMIRKELAGANPTDHQPQQLMLFA